MVKQQSIIDKNISPIMIFRLLANNYLLIIICIVLCVVIESVRYYFSPNVVKSNVTIQIGSNDSVVPKNSTDTYGADVMPLGSDPSDVVKVVNQINSLDFLSEVAISSNLDVDVKPVKFPIIGDLIYNRNTSVLKDKLIHIDAFSKYAFGGQAIEITSLKVSRDDFNKVFILKYLGNRRFNIYNNDYKQSLIMVCTVDKLCNSPDSRLSIYVNYIVAHVGQEFLLTKENPRDIATRLKGSLLILPLDNDFSKDKKSSSNFSGAIQISLIGLNKELNEKILNNLQHALINKSSLEQKRRVSEFLLYTESQLVNAQNNVYKAREDLKAYKVRNNIAGASIDKQYELDTHLLNDLTDKINDVNIMLSTLEEVYGESYPAIISAKTKRNDLIKQKEVVLRSLSTLPGSSADLITLNDNILSSENMLATWQGRLSQVQITYNTMRPSITVVDEASSEHINIKSKHQRFLILSIVGGFILSIFIILLSMIIKKNRDPFLLSKLCNISTTNIIRYSKNIKECFTFDITTLKLLDWFLLHIKFSKENNTIIGLFSINTGVGVSSTAMSIALSLINGGNKVLLLSCDDSNLFFDKYSDIDKLLTIETISFNNFTETLNYNHNHGSYDFIIIDYGNIKDNIVRAESFINIAHRCIVVGPDTDREQLIETTHYLSALSVPINNVFYNYNKKKFINDFYSK